MDKYISLAHGNGGRYMRELIAEVFARHLADPARDYSLNVTLDAAPIALTGAGEPYITTDGFIVQPLEFPGGDIGSLAVNGTVNDLAVAGATPRYLSLNAFIEEGLEIATLERTAQPVAAAQLPAGVAGDTKAAGEGGGSPATTGAGCAAGRRPASTASGRATWWQRSDRRHGTRCRWPEISKLRRRAADCGHVIDLARRDELDGLRFMRDRPARTGRRGGDPAYRRRHRAPANDAVRDPADGVRCLVTIRHLACEAAWCVVAAYTAAGRPRASE
jgi:hypothetical protein